MPMYELWFKKTLKWSLTQSFKSSSIQVMLINFRDAYKKRTTEFISVINFKREASEAWERQESSNFQLFTSSSYGQLRKLAGSSGSFESVLFYWEKLVMFQEYCLKPQEVKTKWENVPKFVLYIKYNTAMERDIRLTFH